jgi:hypothetical protein
VRQGIQYALVVASCRRKLDRCFDSGIPRCRHKVLRKATGTVPAQTSRDDVATSLLCLLPCLCLVQHPPIECICRPGEVLYIPRGWWHCVFNLGHTVAVTQNYVSSTGLPKVLDFLKPGRVELVSGCGMQDRWVSDTAVARGEGWRGGWWLRTT